MIFAFLTAHDQAYLVKNGKQIATLFVDRVADILEDQDIYVLDWRF